jgi:hypothetical protein
MRQDRMRSRKTTLAQPDYIVPATITATFFAPLAEFLLLNVIL